MGRFLPVIAIFIVTVYCLVDCIQTDDSRVRNLPKFVWLLIILFFNLLGSVAWLLAGRPNDRPLIGPPRRERPRGPDDDPDFLRGL